MNGPLNYTFACESYAGGFCGEVLCSRSVMICSFNCTIAGSSSVFKTIIVLPVSRMLCSTFLTVLVTCTLAPRTLRDGKMSTSTACFCQQTAFLLLDHLESKRCPWKSETIPCRLSIFLFLWRWFRGIPWPPCGGLPSPWLAHVCDASSPRSSSVTSFRGSETSDQ